MERNAPIIKNNWIEIYFGLFGPQFTYHTNGYGDNARLVISLIIFKFYFKLPWKTKSNDKGKYFGVYGHYTTGIYGFYTAQEPDRIIFSWGEQPRYFCMPWTLKVVKSEYIGEESKLVDRPYTRKHTNVFYGEIDYWVKRNTLRRVIWGKIEWFDRYEFIVYTNIKPTDSNQTFTFSTDSNVCIPEQIDLQLLMFDEENF